MAQILFDLESMQHEKTIFNFEKLFEQNKFDMIIEIGTAWGSLTVFFGVYGIIKHCAIYSFDIAHPQTLPRAYLTQEICDKLAINFICGDVFSSEISEKIKNLINSNGKCLVLCDGGDKIREFNLFALSLKCGDVIMAHDYCYDKNPVKNMTPGHILPQYVEIQYSDIKDAADKCNLEFHLNDNFDEVA